MISRIKVQVGADIDSIRLIIPPVPDADPNDPIGSEAVKEYEYEAPRGVQHLLNVATSGWQIEAAEKVRVPFTRVPLPRQAVGQL